MAHILPLGFIDRTTEDGAIFMLTNPSESHLLSLDTPVTLRTRSVQKRTATARVRGSITAVGYVTAIFRTVESKTDSCWPKSEHTLRRGTPVYQALPGTFHPDPDRTLTPDQAEDLRRIATRYRNVTKSNAQKDDSPAP